MISKEQLNVGGTYYTKFGWCYRFDTIIHCDNYTHNFYYCVLTMHVLPVQTLMSTDIIDEQTLLSELCWAKKL